MEISVVRAVGTDVVSIRRIAAILQKRSSERFLRRILHVSEYRHFCGLLPEHGPRYVAGCWATKEAVFKTLDRSDQLNFAFSRWYRYKMAGKPCVANDDPSHRDSYLVSISHEQDTLVAFVLRQSSVFVGEK